MSGLLDSGDEIRTSRLGGLLADPTPPINPMAALLSWANGVKRRMSNPLETIGMGLIRGTEDLQNMGRNEDVAYGLNGMKSVLLSPDQRAQAARAANDFGGNLGFGAATVWHGSPHKFDKFDASKIGTGEGAQAYGHGLYLAENPKVANGYAVGLGQGNVELGGVPLRDLREFRLPPRADGTTEIISTSREARGLAANILQEANGDKTLAAQMARRLPDRVSSSVYAMVTHPDVKVIPPSLYKVDLPDTAIAKMLDWDKPLSQQAPEVADAVRKAFPGTYINGRYVDPANSQFTGKALLDQLTAIANKRGAPGMRQAEPALREAGVTGIRYLDGGSRGAGQGSSNFVIFPGNEGLLQILERNGAPIK